MKTTLKKISALLIILTLLFTLTLSLSSCKAGSEEIYSKETLSENVSSEKNEDLDYVWEYLNNWDFPSFDKIKFKRAEEIYRDEYYKEIPSAYDLAIKVGNAFIENSYDSIDLKNTEKVTDALISAFVAAIGDRYSFYRTNEQYDNYTEGMSGSFVGIGVSVRTSLSDGCIYVIEPLKNSPAKKAGILAGDLIYKIDGSLVSELGYTDSVNKIKGKSGTKVVVTVKRGDDIIDITVTRARVTELTVDYEIDENGVGYIDINSFKDNTDDLFKEAIKYMKANGAKAVIYDVRDNGGGYLDAVVNMLDYIAKDGVELVSFSNDYGSPKKAKDGYFYNVPTVILCNGATASASELFTSGLRDIATSQGFKVTIVGQKTYGKGVMQNTATFLDGSAITLTVAYYNPPSGVNYDGVGITPSVTVTGNAAQLEAAYAEANKLIN